MLAIGAANWAACTASTLNSLGESCEVTREAHARFTLPCGAEIAAAAGQWFANLMPAFVGSAPQLARQVGRLHPSGRRSSQAEATRNTWCVLGLLRV